jgi:hypothetical protein
MSLSNTDSPLQQVCKILIERVIPMKMMSIAVRLIPSIAEIDDVLRDPYKLHQQVEEAVVKLLEVLKYDHDAGYRQHNCISPTESFESILSRNDGDGKVDVGGGTSERVQTELLDTEVSSQDADRGHEATLERKDGDEWDTD